MQNQNPNGVQNPMDSATTTPNVSPVFSQPAIGVARTGQQPVATTPTPNFQARWKSSPQYQASQARMGLLKTAGQTAQAGAQTGAKQQAAGMGLDPNSVAYRRLMQSTRDQGMGQYIDAHNEAAVGMLDDQEAFRKEDMDKAIAAFEMMDLNQKASDEMGAALTEGEDISQFVRSLTKPDGGAREEYQKESGIDQQLGDQAEIYKAMNPDATDEEANAWAQEQMTKEFDLTREPVERASREAEIRDTVLQNGDTANFSTEDWMMVNADESLRDIVAPNKIGTWWDDTNFFDKRTRGRVSTGQVNEKLQSEGLVEGNMATIEGQVAEINQVRVKETNHGARVEAKIYLTDPMTGRTYTVTKKFDRR
jgi:hypothetical protein